MQNVESVYPLSPMQRQLLLHLRTAGSAMAEGYVEQITWAVRGGFRADDFERAVRRLLERQPVLRTGFFWEGLDEPLQVVRRDVEPPLAAHDWSALPEAERAERLDALLRDERARGFDPTAAPLLRIHTVRLAPDEVRVVWSYHHLVMDGWSSALALRELLSLYRDGGHAAPPGPRFAGYLGWLAGRDAAGDEAFWRRALAGAAPMALPGTRAAAPGAQARHRVAEARLDEELAARLRAAARTARVTLNTVFQGAWALLLSRYAGTDDVVLGEISPGRGAPVPGIDTMLGVFTHAVPVRVRARPADALHPWLRALQAEQAEARQHEHAAERWSGAAEGGRLFDTLFLFQNLPDVEVTGATLAGERVEGIRRVAEDSADGFLLKLEVRPVRPVSVRLTWDDARLEGAVAEAALGHYLALLEGFAAGAERLADLRLDPPAAPGAPRPIPAAAPGWTPAEGWDETPWARFARVAACQGERPAVVDADGECAYAELHARAEAEARALLALRGAGAERVGVMCSPGRDVAVAVLGVLVAGKSFVPLDPAYPAERLRAMMADAGAAALLAAPEHATLAREVAGDAPVLRLGTEAEWTAPLPRVDSGSPAYVLYTSGSTGRPKGVAQSHRNLLRHIATYVDALRMGPGDRVVMWGSYAFDGGLMDLFGALLSGAALCPYDVRASGTAGLAGWVRERGATVLHATPTVYRHFLADTPAGTVFGDVRAVALGGEEARRTDWEAFRLHFPAGCVLVNGLGPTECTVGLQHFMSPAEPPAAATLPVGRAVPGVEVRLRTAVGDQPAPFGVGEIELRGPVASGYWGRPAETAAAFHPAPRGERAYRTGDLGRWLPDGSIEFVGRADHQVKVRGVRVEPAEVEAALLAHPGVREAVVAARGDGGERRLVAWIVPRDAAHPPAPEALREHLRGRLPDAMVPAAFAAVERFPLTSTGKVNRAALPEPTAEARAFVAPRTPMEALVAGVFAEVLGVERVGAQDDFFALGGHSLLGARAVGRLRQVTGTEVPLRALFEATDVAGVAARVDELRRGGRAVALPPVERAGRGVPLPLSFAQRRLWFLQRLDPESGAYNVPLALRLEGELDVDALARALSAMVERHEALRTVFAEDGEPVQVILPPRPAVLEPHDLSALAPAERAAAVHAAARAGAEQPFDLARGPLFRAALLRLDEREHHLLLTLHHAVSDGWSTDVLVREMAALYEAFTAGREAALPELPVQYADYALWQREQLRGEVLERSLAYWRERLAGVPVLELPTDRPRPAASTDHGATVRFRLGAEAAAGVRALARREGATPFMVLLAAFQLLLSRYTGQEDVAVGTPVAGRTRAELEGVVGPFLNTLVLRTDLSGEPTFGELVGRVREATLGAYEHQELPFERLVEELSPDRSLARTPLFQVMFAFQTVAGRALRLGPVSAVPVEVETGTARFDLTLAISDDGEGFAGALEYGTDLLDAATAERMAAHFQRLLRSAAAGGKRPASELEMNGDAERRAVAAWGTPAETAAPAASTVHALFEARADADPSAPALVWEGGSLTFDALERRANRVAHALRARGVGAEGRVAVALERGPELAAALLGVLKAGSTAVPLDPADGSARRAHVLADAGAAVVVTREALAHGMAAGVALCVDGGELDAQPESRPGGGALPGSAAYVVYTSGSTGAPKGVVVEHRALAAHLAAAARAYGYAPGDRVLHFASPAFDVSLEQLLAPLVAGAAVVPRPDAPWTGADLLRFAAGLGVTAADVPPGFLAAVLDEVEEGAAVPPALRLVLCGGEALPADTARRFRAGPLGGVRLVNAYGPTEAVVTATTAEMDKMDEGTVVPLGAPLAQRRVYVLDRALRPVPPGVPGELCLGGALLARGYLGRAAGTAERFVPDPFAGEPGARLYRTGDRARWRADGSLEFLGRMDEQVQVRGIRVEPAEVEAALRAHPAVRDAAVAAHLAPGGARLVAYVVGDGAGDAALRAHLATLVPEALVPAAFVRMDALPRTPAGKLDRRALPDPGAPRAAGLVEPRTPSEEVVAGIFGDVLGAGRVGAHDSFFEMGGHSLLAARVVSRVRGALGVEVPLRAVFEAPTPAALAARVDEMRRSGAPAGAPPIARVPRDEPAPLSFGQRRLWFLHQLDPDGAAYHIPLAIRLRGALDVPALRRALDAAAARHEALRTVFRAGPEGEPVQVVLPPAPVELPVLEPRGEDVEGRLREEARRPFDLQAGPPFRAALLRLQDDEHVLVMVLHHAAADGWSVGVLADDLSALYAAYAAGGEPDLPALPVQYADFAAWQRVWGTGEVLRHELEYWRRHLAGAPPRLELPTDFPRAALPGHRGAEHLFALPPVLGARVEALARARGATPFMVLLAAFQLLLARVSGETDVVVGSPVAGRTREETERVVGFFVNTLPLRTDVGGDPTFAELLERVRETTLGAYDHQALPFERMVEELGGERSMAHAPLYQVVFALQNAPEGAFSFPGLEHTPVEVSTGASKLDLALRLTPAAGGFAGVLAYDPDLFEEETARSLARRYGRLLERVTEAPEERVSRVELLEADERRRVVEEWGRAPREERPPECLHHAWEAQARRAPDALAVVSGGERLSYGALDLRANRLAHRLRRLGVGPEVRVAICMERSLDAIVAVWGVLKAGGAYVPLDPAYPPDRLRYMLEDAAVPVLLTQRALAGQLPAGAARVVCVDEPEPAAPGDDEAPAAGAGPDGLAYVIYTSGSTGRPKGVMVQHREALNYIRGFAARLGVEPGARFAMVQPFAFDSVVTQIFVSALTGGTLYLFGEEDSLDPDALGDAFEREGMDCLKIVPSHLAALLRGRRPERVLPRRWLVIGGEGAHPAWVKEVQALAPECAIFNHYGATETSVAMMMYRFDAAAPVRTATLPLGRPLPNTVLYVLDEWMRPVPAGTPGEIFIGGGCLARGYLGRPALSAERFVPDPFSDAPGARLYRTGDRGRWLSGGTLEFLGRVDFQAKVRGFRIEPGEVESALLEHPQVRRALVLVREDGGERRLVAYVEPRDGEAPEPSALREHAGGRLPAYMVPAAVVVLQRLPITPNGKVDRRALPAPELGRAAEYVAPRTPAEARLAALWAEVLGVERVGAHDDFFALGGHSLLVTRVVSRVREAWGVELPLRTLFEAPELAAQAERIERFAAEAREGAAAPILGSGELQGMLDRMDEMDEAGMDALLARMAAEEEP